jgi:hypothetical protein
MQSFNLVAKSVVPTINSCPIVFFISETIRMKLRHHANKSLKNLFKNHPQPLERAEDVFAKWRFLWPILYCCDHTDAAIILML